MSDKLISISAMITALIAVVIGVVELQTNREFQRLSVEPYLEISSSNRNGYEGYLINTGLGPARINTVNVEIDGKSISKWSEAVEILTGDDDSPVVYSGLWNGRQLKSEEQVVFVHLTEQETARIFFESSSRVNIRICYCSIYSDCWLKEDFKKPTSVDNCPENGRERFPFD